MELLNIASEGAAGNLVFAESAAGNGAQVHFGRDASGLDVRMFGATTGSEALWDESADALLIVGPARLDFSSATVAAANTDGGCVKGGTSAARVVEDTADMKFVSWYTDCGATSGDSRGHYYRHYVTGAGGGGECLRAFTTVENVAGATAHGAHVSLSFGATGTVTGLGVAARATLHIADQATQGGTLSAVQAEIYSDGDTSDPSGARLSCIRVVNDGGAGTGNVDDDAALIDFAGWTAADGNMLAVKAAGAVPNVTHSIRLRLPDGSHIYLYAGADPLTA